MSVGKKALGPHIGLDESDTIEFKESWQEDAMADLAALANRRGGTLFIGVDKRGFVVGCDVSDQVQQVIATKIQNHLQLTPDVRVVVAGMYRYLSVTVPKAASPVMLRNTYYQRAGTTTLVASGSEAARLILDRLGQTWDEQPANGSVDELIDPDRVRTFIVAAQARERSRLPAGMRETDPLFKVLEHLELLVDGRPTNAAVLLFGKRPQQLFRSARIKLLFQRAVDNLTPFPDGVGTIFEQVEHAVRTIETVNPSSLTFTMSEAAVADDGVPRPEAHPIYPRWAVREAVLNALIHRDYLQLGAAVEIKMYPDRLVVLSPGTLPAGMTVDALRTDPHRSVTRNPRLAYVSFLDFLVESYGTGTLRMIDECRKAGLPAPEFVATADSFIVTFRRDLLVPALLEARGLTARQIQAVLYIKQHGAASAMALAAHLRTSRSTVQRELEGLLSAPSALLAKTAATGRGTRYILRPAADRISSAE